MGDVYDFSYPHAVAPRELRELLGGKGANLAEMTSVLKLPVPHGFTITTEACRTYLKSGWPDQLTIDVQTHLDALEKKMQRHLGDRSNPLLVSVRSGAAFSMPGMMDTVLNLGLNDDSVEGLARQTHDERFAYDSYRRFIHMYARIVLGLSTEPFDLEFARVRTASQATSDALIPSEFLRELVSSYKNIIFKQTGNAFPETPTDQLKGAIEAVLSSWNGPRAIAYRAREHIAEDLGTAVNVQAMVFGNRDDSSGTGVGFTRNPATGEKRPYGDFLVNAQGEDVVAGIRATEPLDALRQRFPVIYNELIDIFSRLEAHYRDMCDTEFTIEQNKLWMLQTRVGKRTALAAVRMAVEMVEDPVIRLARSEALGRVQSEHLNSVLHPQFATTDFEVLAQGLGASPGAAVGAAYFDADRCVDAAHRGIDVLLMRNETSPDDVHGLLAAKGVLTARGGLVSHAAVVARGWGKPAVVGVENLVIDGDVAHVGDVVIHEGDVLSIDGSSGVVVLGPVDLVEAEPPNELKTLLSWADEVRANRIGVRANADTGDDARRARQLGAEGIGLCRTEHMFLTEDRLPIMREIILAETEEQEVAALKKLRAAQRYDFVAILEAMDGLPVTVRLLDPPLHEFLPDVETLAIKEATEGLSEEEHKMYQAARTWREVNPMLGTRGVRLAVVKPGLYTMQVRALLDAAKDRIKVGGHPIIEVMIPLTVSREELALARTWVEEALQEIAPEFRDALEVAIGTMIETPRAALLAFEIAQVADFLSFGTNDLTQLTFGFSRDDIESRLMGTYLEQGLLASNPFETVDSKGVGELVSIGIERGRLANESIKCGVCGEHGGDPESIELFARVGIDYVSCSPYRVPIARLAAAQALVAIDAENT